MANAPKDGGFHPERKSMTDSTEEKLTPEGAAALREIARFHGISEDEVIQAVSAEAVRRRPIVEGK